MARFLGVNMLFAGRHFDREIIILCVRWYLRFKLSFRDLVEMMTERGLPLAHTTIMRWVRHYAPEFERRWNRFARPAGASWRVDETYIKVRGEWVYLCRAVDAAGRTVDFRLSRRRDVAAVKAFFRKALKRQGSAPRSITLAGSNCCARFTNGNPTVPNCGSKAALRQKSGIGVGSMTSSKRPIGPLGAQFSLYHYPQIGARCGEAAG